MTTHPVNAPDAPKPIGPYSQAMRDEGSGLLYLSGQTPIDPATGALIEGAAAAQATQVFENLRRVLAAADAGPADVVKVNVYDQHGRLRGRQPRVR